MFCLTHGLFFLFMYLFLAVWSFGCGTQVSLWLWHTGSVTDGILVPLPAIEPVFPAFEGGFLTTGPPWKSLFDVWFLRFSFESLRGDKLLRSSPPTTPCLTHV